MTIPTLIKITLQSAATFGRGDGVAGLVDREIEHDRLGFPFLRGKTLKGLLAESAENVVFALNDHDHSKWVISKDRLFGSREGVQKARGILHIGDAQIPIALREEIKKAGWKADDVLQSLTGIRRQTAVNEFGAPAHGSLRSMRVLLPGVTLEAPLSFESEPEDSDLQILAAAGLDFHLAGTGRNRGRGWIKAELDNDNCTRELFNAFAEAIL